MKRTAVILLLTMCFMPSLYGQKTRYAQEPPKAKPGVDYPIKVHISGVHVRTLCLQEPVGVASRDSCNDTLYADAIVNGARIELMGDFLWFPGYPIPLLPGDYQARIFRDHQTKNGTPLFLEYELVFPDRSVWHSTVTGFSE